MSFAAAEADRRIANTIQVGRITAVGPGHARVRIGDLDTPDLPVAQLRAGALSFWWMPTVGEQVVVACPSGDVARGIILASIFAANAPSASLGTPMIDLAGGNMVINGSVQVTGGMTVAQDVVASGVSLVGHVHGGITPGGSNTGQPV